jgi:hypothetical protein
MAIFSVFCAPERDFSRRGPATALVRVIRQPRPIRPSQNRAFHTDNRHDRDPHKHTLGLSDEERVALLNGRAGLLERLC